MTALAVSIGLFVNNELDYRKQNDEFINNSKYL